MAKGRRRNITNRNQGNMATSEPNSPLPACPGYPITPVKQDLDLKSLVMMLVEEHMKDIVKEIQEKMDQKLEALTGETQPSSVAEIALEPLRRLKHQPETRPTNSREQDGKGQTQERY